ncbi:hypothetical protein CBR_g23216 [Chara braunii]|uniref:Uncharacterized protein n=1 Tax=Chara braunii TaxID=69332 RepID=A0A388JV78_CHABU|nr:hypothetical protein CBR_g23216 [Chara braunii]|eukprot:GBG61701.1 hypothetical protein CBR_g23216 [Chara braunii]
MNLKKKEVCDMETLRAKVDNLKKIRNLPAATVNEVETSVRLQREYGEAKRKAQEANERRIAALEEQLLSLKNISEEAMNEAKGWKLEAQRSGNKRGNVAVGVTPSPLLCSRPRCAPAATPPNTKKKIDDDYSELVARHMEEVNVLKEMRIREFNWRREAEQEAERVKEMKDKEIEKLKVALSKVQMKSTGKTKVSRMKETQCKSTATDLRQRLEAAIGGGDGGFGNFGTEAAEKVAHANDREGFLRECRLTWWSPFVRKKELHIPHWTRRRKRLPFDGHRKLVMNCHLEPRVGLRLKSPTTLKKQVRISVSLTGLARALRVNSRRGLPLERG